MSPLFFTQFCEQAEATGGEAEATGGGDSASDEPLTFVTGDFRPILAELLARGGDPSTLAVVAVHACNFLTDAVIETCVAAGVDFAVMPCCGRDTLTAGQLTRVASTLKTSLHAVVDVTRFGMILGHGFDCRWRTIDSTITPENRILVGLASKSKGSVERVERSKANADAKMSYIYAKIHGHKTDPYAAAPPYVTPVGSSASGLERANERRRASLAESETVRAEAEAARAEAEALGAAVAAWKAEAAEALSTPVPSGGLPSPVSSEPSTPGGRARH